MGTATASDRENLKAVWAPFMKTMLSALGKLPKLPMQKYFRGRWEDFMTMRGIYNAGREVTWASFTSVSRSVQQAAYLANWDQGCVLEMKLSEVPDVSRFSFYVAEEEGILLPNSRFVVLNETRTEEILAGDGQSYIVKFIALQHVAAEKLPLIS
jgi:hypothetical protein